MISQRYTDQEVKLFVSFNCSERIKLFIEKVAKMKMASVFLCCGATYYKGELDNPPKRFTC